MRRRWNRSEPSRRVRTWAGVLVAVGAAAALLAPAPPASAATLPATQTALVVDRTTALPGDPVLLTATVSVPSAPGTMPTGSVTFKRGSIVIGSTGLTDGVAKLTATDIPVGSRSLTATYAGDGTLAPSTSSARTILIAKGATATTVAAVPDALPGDPVLLSATVAGPDLDHPATGTVTFKRGSTAIGTAALTSGAATLPATLPAGTIAVTAVFNGSTSLNGSQSAPISISVVKAATTTVLMADTSLAGAPATLTATVSSVGISRVPTGKVTFRRGSTSLGIADLDEAGVARLSASLPSGPLTLTATYGGSTSLNASTSAPANLDLQKASTTTTLALDPSGFSPAGSPVTLTATTTVEDGRIPTGTIAFKRGTTTIGTAPLVDGVATLSAPIPIGTHAITATYNGTAALIASTSTATTITVAKLFTTTYLDAPSTSTFGEPVLLRATAMVPGYDRIPTGTVTFLRGSTVLGSAPVDGGGTASLSTTALPVGSPALTARYDGSSGLSGSTSTPVGIDVAQAATTISVSPFTPPATAGEPVSLQATVTATAPSQATPTGKVTFRSGTTTLGQVTLVGGVADLSTTALPAGATSVVASYGGNASFLASSLTYESVLGAPTDVTVEPGRESALVSFTPPANDGGSPITSFTVVAADSTGNAPQVIASGPWSPIDVAGLVAGHTYVFTVTVENEAGASATSESSDPVVVLEPCPTVDGTSERSAAAPGVDWHGCDLAGADVSGLDLTGANLADTALGGANLTATDLGGADLQRANLAHADVEGADLAGALLGGATFTGLHSGNITGTPTALPSNTYLVAGYLIGGGASLREADLPGADLAGTFLGGSPSAFSDWYRSDLHGATLRGAFMAYTNLDEADLTDVDLHGAYAILASFRSADLTGADLTGAHIGGSDFTGADFTDADLTGADLYSPPGYPQIKLDRVTYCRTTMPSGEIDNSGCPA